MNNLIGIQYPDVKIRVFTPPDKLVGGIFPAATLVNPTARAGAFLAILGSLLVLFRVFSKEDVAWLHGLIRKK